MAEPTIVDKIKASLENGYTWLDAWFTHPGDVAVKATTTTEKTTAAIAGNIATGLFSMLPVWVWVIIGGLLILYLLPLFRRMK
jgi:hypothetical protein